MPAKCGETADSTAGEQADGTGGGGSAPPPFDDLYSAVYEELRRRAAQVKRSGPPLSVGATTLVDEAWIRLRESPRFATLPHGEFFRLAGRVMRDILVDAARRRRAKKRPQRADAVELDQDLMSETVSAEVLAVHEAIEELARLDPPCAQIVELHYFGGLTAPAVAAALDISESAVHRQLRLAKTWLRTHLRED